MPRLRTLSLVLLACAGPLAPVRSVDSDDKPRIRAISPASALRGTVVDVTIEGTNLHRSVEVKVSRPEIGVTVTGSPTPTKLVVRLKIPDDAAAGPLGITVRTKTGVATNERFTIRLRAPVVTKVRPDTLARGAEHDVVVTGSNLVVLGAETRVSVDAPLSVKVLGTPTEAEMRLRVVVPADAPPGPRSLLLENAEGRVSTLLVVALAPPTVAKPESIAVERASTTTVELTGRNLASTTAVLAIPDREVEIRPVDAPSDAPTTTTRSFTIRTSANAEPGRRLLVVRSADGHVTLPFEVRGARPVLGAAEPPALVRGTTSDIRLPFGPLPEGSSGRVRAIPVDPELRITERVPGALSVAIGAHAIPGPHTLVVSHPWGLGVTPFLVGPRVPSVTGVEPAEIAPGSTADVVFEGRNLEGAEISLAAPDPSVVVSPGTVGATAKVQVKADAQPGPRALALKTADGFALGYLTVAGGGASAPSVASVLPARIVRGTATRIALTGANLRAGGGPPTVTARDSAGAAVPVTVASDRATSLEVVVTPPPETPLGGLLLAIRTPDGATAAALTVLAASPVLEAIEPSPLLRGATRDLVVTGTNLVGLGGRAPSVTLGFLDETPVPVTVASATPERLALKVDASAFPRRGDALLTLTTSEGAVAGVVQVDGVPPLVETVAPVVVGTPSIVEVVVTGRNLLGGDGKPGAVQVTRLGEPASLAPLVIKSSPTELVVRVATTPSTPPGLHVLRVRTLDGESAGLFSVVAVPPPTIQRLAPAVAPRNGGALALLTGTGLTGASVIEFSGAGVTGTILPGGKETQLELRISVAADAAPGPRTFVVTGPGGKASSGSVVLTVE